MRIKNNDGSLRPGLDKKGQMQVMEIITAGLVLLSALNFVAMLPPAVSTSGHSSDPLQELGGSTLMSLGAPGTSEDYSSLLEEYLVTSDIGALLDFINTTLDVTRSYNLFVYPSDFDGDPIMIFKTGESIGEATSAHYPVVISRRTVLPDTETDTHVEITPGVYDVVLLMWDEPRGWTD
jgi:hypothetical protein